MKQLRVYGSSDLSAQLSDYAASMGVSRDLIATAERINPDSIHILTPQEIRRWHLASTEILKSAEDPGLVSAKPSGERAAHRGIVA